MTETDHIASGGNEQPAPVSSTSSLNSLVGSLDPNTFADPLSSSQFLDPATNQTASTAPQPQSTTPTESSSTTTNTVTQPQPQHEQPYSQPLQMDQQQKQQHLSTNTVTPSSIAVSPAVPSGGEAAKETQGVTHQPTMPTLFLPPQQHTTLPAALPSVHEQIAGTPSAAAMPVVAGSQAPEFLYQLTKMLTDDNRDTIEWNQGKIEVHSPHRLEAKVLHKYFRHSKFASFQRQLNYFGFRKQAGKGKMAPCSYVNENLPSTDLSCLLHIKRKASVSTSEKAKLNKKVKNASQQSSEATSAQVNPVLAGILKRSSMAAPASTSSSVQTAGEPAHQAVAQAAVGRGIRHSFSGSAGVLPTMSQPAAPTTHPSSASIAPAPVVSSDSNGKVSESGNNPLSQLVNNYRNTLNDMSTEALVQGTDPTPLNQMGDPPFTGFLSREDSLIDLAMIPIVDSSAEQSPNVEQQQTQTEDACGDDDGIEFSFIDFPNPEVYPSSKAKGG